MLDFAVVRVEMHGFPLFTWCIYINLPYAIVLCVALWYRITSPVKKPIVVVTNLVFIDYTCFDFAYIIISYCSVNQSMSVYKDIFRLW